MSSSMENPKLENALRAMGVGVEKGVPLATLGSFQLGGPVQTLLRVTSPDQLQAVRSMLFGCKTEAVLIGEGTNLLFSDLGWPGWMVRYADGVVDPIVVEPGQWEVSASVELDALSHWAAQAGLSGLEPFTGIPGTVGGAVVGNAGAWGVQMEHVITSVKVVGKDGGFKTLSVSDCGFSYRDSRLKHGEEWVASVCLQLSSGCPQALEAERQRILGERAARHPEWRQTPCIGSFFRNLEPSSKAGRRQAAGWFLEAAGAKTFEVGGAGVFAKHANIPIKRTLACTAEDVAALARQMQKAVREVHGIDLVREVRYLGEFEGESGGITWF